MKEFGWGFIESCYKYFSHDQPSATITDEAFNTKVKQLFDYILTDVKWMADIKAISLKEGLSTDSIAMKQAQYLISEEMKKIKLDFSYSSGICFNKIVYLDINETNPK